MSLNYDLSKVKDSKDLHIVAGTDDNGTYYKLSPATEAIVFATMVIGWGEITEANAPDFWVRLDMYQKVAGGLLANDKDTIWLTPEDVTRHIGLSTNVFPKTSTATFRARMQEVSADRSDRAWSRAKNRKAAPAEASGLTEYPVTGHVTHVEHPA